MTQDSKERVKRILKVIKTPRNWSKNPSSKEQIPLGGVQDVLAQIWIASGTGKGQLLPVLKTGSVFTKQKSWNFLP